jgi:hypothetical protein
VRVVGPGKQIVQEYANLDTCCDYVVLASGVAASLGLTLPFSRQTGVSSAGGTQAATFSFPPDGLVSLFVTDYREYAWLPGPLVGFHAPGPGAAGQRSVLGQTGFLQYFRFMQDPSPPRVMVELDPLANFPGQTGLLPKDGPLEDFIRSLRSGP